MGFNNPDMPWSDVEALHPRRGTARGRDGRAPGAPSRNAGGDGVDGGEELLEDLWGDASAVLVFKHPEDADAENLGDLLERGLLLLAGFPEKRTGLTLLRLKLLLCLCHAGGRGEQQPVGL